MKLLILGIVAAVMSISAPAMAGHYNTQTWQFATDNCDSVPPGGWCEAVVVEVATSNWCGASCSASEKAVNFDAAMARLQAFWTQNLKSLGFRGMRLPTTCGGNYSECQTVYSDGYSAGSLSVWNIGDESTGSWFGYSTEVSRRGFFRS